MPLRLARQEQIRGEKMDEKNYNQEFFRTTSVQDFKLSDNSKSPFGYPERAIHDKYSKEICAESYEERKKLFTAHVLNNPGTDTVKGFFYELIRLSENKGPIHEGKLFSAVDYVNNRIDCADFVVAGLLRLYYQFNSSEMISEELKNAIKQALLHFKYWPDEPGIDSMCYWTENHHIIFSANELLAGQMFVDEIFGNSGMTGAQKIKKSKKRIKKWLEMRFYTGFNEWLSNVYYDEDFTPLLNLLDFCEDQEIADKSKVIIDLMLYDMACNSYYGQFSCSHGRTYTKEKLHPYKESTIDTAKLMFGMGVFANEDNMSAVMFALSKKYVLPNVIYRIAADTQKKEWINKQRVSIKFKDARKWGYGKMDTESAMGLLSFGGYCHYRTINHMILMLDAFRWWNNQFFLEFKPFKKALRFGRKIGLTNFVAWLLRKDLSRNAFEESNIYTYRTPEYMLSTAQDYRKGYGGDQHHIWQATLDEEAVCFTTHPGGYGEKAPDAYWHGNGFMPKAIQHKNVAVIIYNTPSTPKILLNQTLMFTHAFFPRDRFDRVTEKNGWVFGQKNGGYIALYSKNGYQWKTEGEYKNKELLAKGKKNIWVVEMGREETHGLFDTFVESVGSAELKFGGLNVSYRSPSMGQVSIGWNKQLKVDGLRINTREYKRYDNISCAASFGCKKINIRYQDDTLDLSFDDGEESSLGR